jgi:hypothetical protein
MKGPERPCYIKPQLRSSRNVLQRSVEPAAQSRHSSKHDAARNRKSIVGHDPRLLHTTSANSLRFGLLVLYIIYRGHRSLPIKWQSHSSAARPWFGASTWMGSPSILRSFSSRLLRARLSRPFGLCVRPRSGFSLALHPHPFAERNADHRVRACCARLFGLEASPRPRLEEALAVRGRGSDRRAGRRDHSDMGESRPRASRHWSFFSSLQSLRSLSSCHESHHGRWRRC